MIAAMMSASLGPVLLAAGLRGGALWSLVALLLGLFWLAASGLYFMIYLQLGGDDATLVGVLAVLMFSVDVGITVRRLSGGPREVVA